MLNRSRPLKALPTNMCPVGVVNQAVRDSSWWSCQLVKVLMR